MTKARKWNWLDYVAVALTLFAVIPVAWRLSPQARGAVSYLLGETPWCSWDQAVHAEAGSAAKLNELLEMSKATKIISTDEEGNELVSTPDGDYWIPANDYSTLFLILLEQREKIYGEGAEGVKPGDIVLDCGAHVGAYTRTALRDGASLVVAFEPTPRTARCLRKNYAKEIEQGKVIVVEKGVWDKDDTMPFFESDTTAGNSFVIHRSEKPAATLPLTYIDKVVGELNLPRVDFIKMDIEGAERQALAGAAGTIKKFRPRLAIAGYHLPDDPPHIFSAVRAARTDYQSRCTSCEYIGDRIAPHTFLFR